jgi:hypothetical protein
MAEIEFQELLQNYAPSTAVATDPGTEVNLSGQDGGATSGNGGAVRLVGGTAVDGAGGTARLAAGGGGGANMGGQVQITAGSSDGGPGGSIELTSGSSSGGDGNGGDILFSLGIKNGTGVDGHVVFTNVLESFADDAAAATAGIPVGGLYRTASAVKIRVA